MDFTTVLMQSGLTLVKFADGKFYYIKQDETSDVLVVGAPYLSVSDETGVHRLHELDLTMSAFFEYDVIASAVAYLESEGIPCTGDDVSVALVRIDDLNEDGTYIVHDFTSTVLSDKFDLSTGKM